MTFGSCLVVASTAFLAACLAAGPFVFAAWITRKPQYSDNIFELNEALKYGVHHIDEVVDTYDSGLLKKSELKDYLQNDIDYNLDSLKRKALDLFIGKIKNAEIVNQ